MAIYAATYDLHKPDHNYQPLYDFLQQFTHCHHISSVWLIDSDWSAEQLREGMRKKMHDIDTIFVVRLARDWSSWNFQCANWLNDSSRNW